MVIVVERNWDNEIDLDADQEDPDKEKRERLCRKLSDSLGDVIVLDFKHEINIAQGNIELFPNGIVAIYPVDPAEKYKPAEAHGHYPHFPLAEQVAEIYKRETGEEPVIFKYRRRIEWASEAQLAEIKTRGE